MIAPAKAGKFTLYRGERQGFAAERAFGPAIAIIPARRSPKGCDVLILLMWRATSSHTLPKTCHRGAYT
ncbi:hypothetical protein C1X35_08755 [Pseudomonas sp. FW306-1C-G01A]|nr:hypothetical protein [Pseudomonas mandelii]PMV90001.1 hypothetical protein C1X56_02895 [Pseudomonas sp. GW101-1A09]PMV92982.1 hypothetical protein C1X51_16570 [Pseudomonas sp. FW306-2-2C-B10A]PMW03149.1 hypothetical protein C1X55_00945 [Pseudomonas sp. GW460-C8]PMW07729.1 hypothetical protein C1X50_03905 [Pseudomonas sp. MPR-TSA4]PMW16466.1 hypothetical protein C1X40_18815 [Pseudomonas sp. GW456-11-11-14-TSB2]PMW20982.1 hypothetical protein C1X52_04385 [Pseudomonas sp. FW306-2-1A-C05A]PMW